MAVKANKTHFTPISSFLSPICMHCSYDSIATVDILIRWKTKITYDHFIKNMFCYAVNHRLAMSLNTLRGCAKLKKCQNSQKNWIEPNPIIFFLWKPISDTARTLKSQWLLTTYNKVYADRIHHITLIPHDFSITTLEIT